jgi:hypothetical protein
MALDQSIVVMCLRVLRRPHELTAASERGLMTCSGDGRSVNTFSSLDKLAPESSHGRSAPTRPRRCSPGEAGSGNSRS